MLTKYVAVHSTTISDNYFSSGMLSILIKAQTVSILSSILAGKFTHNIYKRTKYHISKIEYISIHSHYDDSVFL